MKHTLRIPFLLCAIICASFHFNALQAQENLEERIHAKTEVLRKDSNNLKVLCDLTGLYLTKPDFAQAIHYGKRLQQLAYNPDKWNRYYVLQSHLLLGQAYTMTGERQLAYKNLSQAKMNAEAVKDSTSLSLVYNGLGLYASNLDRDYYRSLSYFFKGLKIAKDCHDETHRSLLLGNIALIYELKKDTLGLPYALECYERGHETNNIYLIHIGANAAALLHFLKGNTPEALHYIKEDEFLIEHNEYADKALTYALYGNILAGTKAYTSAIEYFQKALKCQTTSQPTSVLYSYIGYANALGQMGRYEEALEQLKKGERYADDHQVLIYRKTLIETYAGIYEKKGDVKEALRYLQKVQAENDSLFNMSKEELIRNLQIEYQTDLLQRKVEQDQLEKANKEHQLQLLTVGIGLIFLLSLFLFFLYRHTHKLYRAIVIQNREAIQREERLEDEIQRLKATVATEAQSRNSKVQKTSISSAEIGDSRAYLEGPSRRIAGTSLTDEKSAELFTLLEEQLRDGRIYTDNQLSREKVADLLGTNRTYLTQIIKERTGKSFTQYVNEFRLREAIRRLSDSEDKTPLKALTAELGFNSMTTFYNLFQTATGMTPSQYRAQVKQL